MQPIVLTGGQSRRFGRDKLREPLTPDGREWLVDRPIAALRTVFGNRVALVGECDPEVALRGDRVIVDRYPGTGPAGGILSALEETAEDVFVLAGDLPAITPFEVQQIANAVLALDATGNGGCDVVLAEADGIQPCIGVYRQSVRARLAARIQAGNHALWDLAPENARLLIPIAVSSARNVNMEGELRGNLDQATGDHAELRERLATLEPLTVREQPADAVRAERDRR